MEEEEVVEDDPILKKLNGNKQPQPAAASTEEDPILKQLNSGIPLKKKDESESPSPGGSVSAEAGKPSEKSTKKPPLSENQERLKKMYEFEYTDWRDKRVKALNDEYTSWANTRLAEIQKLVDKDPSQVNVLNDQFKEEQKKKAQEMDTLFAEEQKKKASVMDKDLTKFLEIQRKRDAKENPRSVYEKEGRTPDVLESTVATIYSGLADQLPKEYYLQRLRMSKGSFGDLFDPRSEMHTFGDQLPEEINRDEFNQWNNKLDPEERGKSYDEKAKKFIIEKMGRPAYDKLKAEFLVKNEGDRVGFEKAIQEQNQQAAFHTTGVVQDLRDVKGASDFLSFAGNMVGQALYRAPIAIATGTTGSIISESASIYDQQLDLIAEKEGITREEVIKKGLDKPADGQALSVLLGVMDATSAGLLLNVFKQAAKRELKRSVVKEFTKGFVKGAVTEGATELAQGEGEVFAASKGAGVDYKPDAWRMATSAVGGAIGGGVLSGTTTTNSDFKSEPAMQVDQVSLENKIQDLVKSVDVNDQTNLEAVANAVESTVNNPVTNEKIQPPETGTDPNLVVSETPKTETPEVQKLGEEEAYQVGITSATEKIPEIQKMMEEGRELESKGEFEKRDQVFNKILDAGESMINDFMGNVKGAKLKLERTVGNFFGAAEPTFKGTLTVTPENKNAAFAAIAAAGQTMKQDAVHISKVMDMTDDVVLGQENEDGSVFEPNIDINFTQKLAPAEVNALKKIIQGEGELAGFTLHPDGKGINLYNISKFTDSGEFINKIAKVKELLDRKGISFGVESSVRELHNIGIPEAGATRTYEQVRGSVPAEGSVTPTENATPDNTPERVSADSVGGAPPASGGVPEQELSGDTSEKQRKFSIQLLNDLDLNSAVRKGLSEEAITYVPKGIKISNAEARAIIEVKGAEAAMGDFLDPTNGMLPDVRVMLGENLIRKFNAEENYDSAIKVADNLAMQLTDLGRGVNAAKSFSLLTPEGVIRYVQKEITKSRDKSSRDTAPKRKKSKEAVDEENKKAIDKILDPKSTTGKVISENVKKGKVKQAIDFLEKLKIEQPKGMATAQIVPLGLPIAAWNLAISTIQTALKAGLTISQAVSKAIKKLQEQGHKVDEQAFRAHFDEQLKDYRVSLDPQKAIKEELKAQGSTIDEIIRLHYTDQEAAKTSLVDKLMRDANVPAAEAEAIQKSLVEAMDELTKAAKEKALKKYLPKAKKGQDQERKNLVEQLIEASNVGALDEEVYRDAISEKLGPKGMTEEQGKDVKRLAEKIQQAKSDFDRNKAQEDLIRYVDKNVKGIRWTDVGMSIWYANVLSGLSTQLQNLYGNLTNTLGEAYTTMALNPKEAGWIFKGLFNGYGRGLLEAMDTVKSGYQPIKGDVKQISASSPVLESIKFKGGPWNPYNYLKYVTRLMAATDIFFYHGLKEMRSRELAVAAAKKENKVNPGQSAIAQAKRQLYGEETAWKDANEQAELEGYTGKEKTRRAYELLEKSRPEYILEDSNDAALRGTYNNQPEGALGMLSGVINMAGEKLDIKGIKPIKFIVPFTRIIANVANTALDYSPWAFGRYMKGAIGYEGFGERYYHKYTQEEKAKLLVKGITGTLAMAALYALTDEEDGIFEITADGTGDMQKNFELQETGWQPYSIKIGDTWYEYRNTPLAIPFAMMGYLRDGQKYRGQLENDQRISILMYGTMKYIMDLSFLQSLSAFFDAFSKESTGSGKNFFEKSAKGTEKVVKSFIVPNAFTQASKSMQEVMDMPQKKATEVGDQIIRDMPVLRDRLDNMYNTLGDPVIPNQVSKFFPFKMKSEPTGKDKELYDIIANNNSWIGKPGRTALKINNGESMTDEEFEQFCYIAGKKTKEKLLENIAELRAMKNGEEIKDLIRKLKIQARREANIQLFGEKSYF